ncbi:MAG: Xaa-Pro peptidase family protein [Syntrophobacterales bacterium]|jgi:Xaa-Pro aminopeptidase|nr:Xaa-Pro peptidase family protein [Syntrophobacterales bacterium]
MLKSLNVCDLTPREEVDARINLFREKMAAKGLSFAVILQNVDLFYFTGTIQKGVLVVSVDDGPFFFVEKSLVRAGIETPLEIIPIKKDKDVKDALLARGLLKGTGGMEFDVLPVAVYERWKTILGYDKFEDISSLIRDVRIVKSPFEITQIKKSGEIISKVFAKAADVVREGTREIDIAAALEAEGKIHGHQGFLRMRGLNQEMMNIYVTHGHSATYASGADVPISGVGVTHAIGQGPSINTVQRGIPLIIDYGSGYNGYITDETRVYAAGELKEIFFKAYEVAREIVEDATVFGKEGIDGTEIFIRAHEKAKKARLEDHFMGYGEGQVGFVGHGLGLEINELPVITPRHHITLKEGMVFAFEPKFIFPNEGAVGIEVDYIVRKDRLERVVDFPIDIVPV